MKLYDAKQASALLGIPLASLAKMRWAGNGCPFIKIGSRIYYRAGDIDKWLEANVRQSTSDACGKGQ